MHIRKAITVTALAGTMLFAQQSGSTTSNKNTDKPNPTSQKTHEGHSAAGTQSGAGSPTLGKQDHMFLMEAARGGMMEVQVAQMAQQKASSDEVKEYARQLEQDHSKANDRLKAIAQERGVSLPSDMAQHQTAISSLNNLSGEQFDHAFVRMQVTHHKKDLNQFRREVKNSMDSDLREFATSNLPTLEQHLQKAQTLASQTGTRGRKK